MLKFRGLQVISLSFEDKCEVAFFLILAGDG